MKNYEINILISPDLSEEEAKTVGEKLASLIREAGGTAVEIRNSSRIRLGQPIRKQKGAYLTVINFSAETDKIKNIREKVAAENQVLRCEISVKKAAKEMIRPRIVVQKEVPPESPLKAPPAETLRETPKPEKKVELKEIEKKLEEILNE